MSDELTVCKHCKEPICFENGYWLHHTKSGCTAKAEPQQEKEQMMKTNLPPSQKELDLQQRQGLLLQVDAIERKWGLPRTSQLRKATSAGVRPPIRGRVK